LLVLQNGRESRLNFGGIMGVVGRDDGKNGAAGSGNPCWQLVTELRTRTAKSLFQFDVRGSVAK